MIHWRLTDGLLQGLLMTDDSGLTQQHTEPNEKTIVLICCRTMRRLIFYILVLCIESTSCFVSSISRGRRYQQATIFHLFDTNGSPDDHNVKNPLSKQDIILQEVLGIQPETYLERQDRLNRRRLEVEDRQRQKLSSIFVAILSFLVAVGNYYNHYTHPTTSLSLLIEMQKRSDSINVIGRNGRPTVVEFWAPWCENCKASAPTLFSIEAEYRDRVNFVHIDANLNDERTWRVIDRFGVDAIPHLAMVGADGAVETALIGPIPRSVLRSDLDVMIENSKIRVNTDRKELPYTMYDAFQSNPDLRHVQFLN